MEITLTVRDGKPTATSMQIAESFEKQHSHVLRAIRDLMNDLSTTPGGKEFTASNFGFSERLDQTGRKVPFYALTRDGFTLLTMGFTGEKALQFKMAYIDAFNRMEAELSRKNLPEALPALYAPSFDVDRIGSPAFRFAAKLSALIERINKEVESGRGYMLPEGVGKVTIPDKTFFGWYTDHTLRFPLSVATRNNVIFSDETRGVTIERRNNMEDSFVFIDLMKF